MINWHSSRIHDVIMIEKDKYVEILYEKKDMPFKKLLLIAHPHPEFEGSMHNKVIVTMARAAHTCNIATLRFNFSAVGRTSGPYIDFNNEVLLLNKIIAVVQSSPFDSVILGGFSFGGAAVLASAQSSWTRILVAPAWRFLSLKDQPLDFKKINIIHALDDSIVPIEESWNGFKMLNTFQKDLYVFGSGSHFFNNHLTALQDRISFILRS